MKKFILLIVLMLLSCQKKQEILLPKLNYFKTDSITTIIGKISVKNTTCVNNINHAIDSINNKNLTYYIYFGTKIHARHFLELKKSLIPLHIKCKIYYANKNPNSAINDCYVDYMNQAIKNKFKKGFIDSLELVADKNHLRKNNNKIYDEENDTYIYK